MLRFLARRLILLLPVVWGISMLAFLLLYLSSRRRRRHPAGRRRRAIQRGARSCGRLFGIDRPVTTRYVEWLSGVARGDLGRSLVTRRPVLTEIRTAFPVTLQLTAAALGVALLVGVPLGVLAADRRGTVSSVGLSLMALLGLSIPSFWLGILLILAASLYLQWFPPPGLVLVWQHPVEAAKQLFFPSLALGLAVGAMVMRMTRSCLLEVLRAGVRSHGAGEGDDGASRHPSARAPERGHSRGHAAGAPVRVSPGGRVVVEEIFSLPGIGRLVLRSISQRDFPLVQGILLLAGVIVVVLNVCVDACYAYLDPGSPGLRQRPTMPGCGAGGSRPLSVGDDRARLRRRPALCALAAPWLAPRDPLETDPKTRLAAPGPDTGWVRISSAGTCSAACSTAAAPRWERASAR